MAPDLRLVRDPTQPVAAAHVRVMLSEDDPAARARLRALLDAVGEFDVVAEAGNLDQTARELEHAGITLKEIVCDGGFQPGPTKDAFPDLTDQQIQISGRHEPGSRRTRKRRARYRTGIEGRISHLKRGYGLRRSRLKGDDGMRTWTGWAILAYDLDTLAIRAD